MKLETEIKGKNLRDDNKLLSMAFKCEADLQELAMKINADWIEIICKTEEEACNHDYIKAHVFLVSMIIKIALDPLPHPGLNLKIYHKIIDGLLRDSINGMENQGSDNWEVTTNNRV